MPVFRRLPVLLLLGLTALARAELVFETEHLKHEASFEEEEFTAHFAFTNNGTEPVTIMNARSSCGCTVPTLEKQNYAPGESGEITARFTYGSRSGLQRKQVTVSTNEGQYQLMLEVEIPQRWKINQRLLRWNERNAATTQSITIEFFHGLPVALEAIDIDEEKFVVKSNWSHEGSRLTIEMTPLDVTKAEMHRADVRVRDAQGEILHVPFYLRLEGPEARSGLTRKVD